MNGNSDPMTPTDPNERARELLAEAMIDAGLDGPRDGVDSATVILCMDAAIRAIVRALSHAPAAQRPGAGDDAIERAAAILCEEATEEPWTVAGVEQAGIDRAYYRKLARRVAAALSQPASGEADHG